MRVVLEHAADPAAMLVLRDSDGDTALALAAMNGNVEAMRVLLDHPSADPAVMMMLGDGQGWIAVMWAAVFGHLGAMRLLLDHPSADVAAMMAVRTPGGASVFTDAARFAAGSSPDIETAAARSCAPLLLLLRRVAVEPQPCAAQRAHMTMVMERLCTGPRSEEMFGSDQPDDVRDECTRLLLERGACVARPTSPVISRIVQEYVQLARVPHLINEAVVGMAIARR
jgi:hypothetical protein